MDRRRGRGQDGLLRVVGGMSAVVVLAEIGAAFALGVGLAGLPGIVGEPVPRGDLWVDVGIVAAGLLLTTARPRNLVGWVVLAFGALGATQNAASVYGARAVALPEERLPFGGLALSLGGSLWVLGLFLLVPVLLVIYPSGRLPARHWRWVVVGGALGAVLLGIGLACSSGVADDVVAGGGPVLRLPDPVVAVLVATGAALLLAAALVSIGGALLRTARAGGPERRQLLWLLLAATTVLVLTVVSPPAWLLAAGLALVPLAVVVGVLAHGLWDLDVVLRPALLYGALTAAVLAVYAGTAAAASVVVPTGSVPAVLAAAAVAVVLAPARAWLQRWVDRLVYGFRPDALAAVRQVGAEVTSTSADPLPAVVAALAGALGARYVGLVDRNGAVLAEAGTDGGHRVVRPLAVGGEHLADLVVVPAGSRNVLDEGVLEAIAAPVAVVVHARRLDRQVAAARARSVQAASDERARIRRDLHDGLGPSLSGMVLGLDALAAQLGGDAETAEEITLRLRREADRAVEEVRRIIDALHPAALDGQGLVPALRERAASVLRLGLVVVVEAPDPLPPLPEHVEVAALRIAEEAVTNVLRHAGATHCVVRLTVDDDLTVTISDDGRGLPTEPTGDGVGLSSMRQRAEELGGSFEVRRDGPGGAVVARLPLRAVSWLPR